MSSNTVTYQDSMEEAQMMLEQMLQTSQARQMQDFWAQYEVPPAALAAPTAVATAPVAPTLPFGLKPQVPTIDDFWAQFYAAPSAPVAPALPTVDDFFKSHVEWLSVKDLSHDETTCYICADDFQDSSSASDTLERNNLWLFDQLPYSQPELDRPIRLPCGHVFGSSCFQECLALDNKCPLCRRVLTAKAQPAAIRFQQLNTRYDEISSQVEARNAARKHIIPRALSVPTWTQHQHVSVPPSKEVFGDSLWDQLWKTTEYLRSAECERYLASNEWMKRTPETEALTEFFKWKNNNNGRHVPAVDYFVARDCALAYVAIMFKFEQLEGQEFEPAELYKALRPPRGATTPGIVRATVEMALKGLIENGRLTQELRQAHANMEDEVMEEQEAQREGAGERVENRAQPDATLEYLFGPFNEAAETEQTDEAADYDQMGEAADYDQMEEIFEHEQIEEAAEHDQMKEDTESSNSNSHDSWSNSVSGAIRKVWTSSWFR